MGHVGWIVVMAIAWFMVWDMWGGFVLLQWLGSGCGTCVVDCGYCNSLVQGVGHVGWIVVTVIAWFRVWDMCGGLWLLQ